MKFIVAKEPFCRLLYLTSSIVEKRNTMPILGNVKIKAEGQADGGIVSITATDLEISLVGKVEAEVKAEGTITVDAKVIYDYIKELPDGPINIQDVKNQKFEISSGQSRFRINATSAEEYPVVNGLAVVNATVVSADKIYDMLDKTSFAVSTDETRFNLNGVYVETVNSGVQQMLRVVATDGHRLAFVDRESEGFVLAEGVIIPRKGIQELKKVLEGNDGVANVAVNEGFFTVNSGNVTIGIRLVDGQFPDYRQVVPVGSTSQFELSRNDFISALRRVSLATDKTRTLKCKLTDGNFVIMSQSSDNGEASETLSVNQVGENVSIGFSARYLIELLSAMSTSKIIKVKFNGELGPAVFQGVEDEDFSCIVMPMRF